MEHNSSLNLKFEILPQDQKLLLQKFKESSWLKNFYLARGTALALHFGHRQSVDFDFFSPMDFINSDIIHFLIDFGKFELFDQSKNAVNGSINGVKISFLGYKYKMLEKPFEDKYFNIAQVRDIASMKIEAISNRGNKRDFVDFYFILNQYPLAEMLNDHLVKYGESYHNKYHIVKSLLYFDDAEDQPMPLMIEKIEWPQIKKKIIEEVKKIKL